jgi:hypothetical protein
MGELGELAKPMLYRGEWLCGQLLCEISPCNTPLSNVFQQQTVFLWMPWLHKDLFHFLPESFSDFQRTGSNHNDGSEGQGLRPSHREC